MLEKDREDLAKEVFFGLNIVDNVNLIEDDESIEDVEHRVVQYPREYYVLEVEKAVGLMHLGLDGLVSKLDYLMILGIIPKKITVVRLQAGKVGIVCGCDQPRNKRALKTVDIHSIKPTMSVKMSSRRTYSKTPWSFKSTRPCEKTMQRRL